MLDQILFKVLNLPMSWQENEKIWVKEKIPKDKVGVHLVTICQILIYIQFSFHGFEIGEGREERGKAQGLS